MKRSQQSVPNAMTGAVSTDDGYKANPHPQSIKPVFGGHNPSVGEHARGGVLGKPGRSVGTGNPQGRLPVQNPPANVVGGKIGQPNPDTAAAATKKPTRRGLGAAFYGEY